MEGWPTAALQRAWPALLGQSLDADGSGLSAAAPDGTLHVRRRAAGRLAPEVFVLDQLTAVGVPVTQTVATTAGERCITVADQDFFVYRDLPGRPIVFAPATTDASTRADWRALGRACADLQVALRTISVDAATAAGVPTRPPSVAPAPTGVQVIHRDFHAGNVLFDHGLQPTGYIDFDHLEIGPRLVDPCYAAGSLLARELETDHEHPVDLWLALWGDLFGGWSGGWRAAGAPVTASECDAVAQTLVEVERDFLDFFVATHDAPNARLTERMIDLVESRAAAMIGAARTQIAQTQIAQIQIAQTQIATSS